MVTILALDMGTSCGWAYIRDGSGRGSGVQRFDLGRGESPGMRFLRFCAWLGEIMDLVSPQIVAYERSAFFRSAAAGEVCHGFQSLMHEEAARRGLETFPVQNSRLKKHATGRGNASKDMMVEAARTRWGLDYVPGHDEADALCILAWAMDELRAPHSGGIRIRRRR